MKQLEIIEKGVESTIYKRMILSKVSPRTQILYSNYLKDFAQYLKLSSPNGSHPLANVPDSVWLDFDATYVSGYLQYLLSCVSKRTGRALSTSTISGRMSAVREFLTEAAELGFFSKETLGYIKHRISIPRVSSVHHAGISSDDQNKLLEYAYKQPGLKGKKDYALFRLWLDTGIRREELVLLEVRDLIMKGGVPVLVVRHGKGNKIREIGLGDYTFSVVEEWLKESGQDSDSRHPIFCQVRKIGGSVYKVVDPDKHLSTNSLWSMVKVYCRKAGIKSKITPHSFRVAMVTDTLNGGAPIQHVKAVTGHASIRTITEVYDRNSYLEPIAKYRIHSLPKRQTH